MTNHDVSYVLDASALLVYLQDESGAERVADILNKRCAISATNWTEVLSKLSDAGQDPNDVIKQLTEQGLLKASLSIIPFNADMSCEAAHLRKKTRHVGLSLGDRACLALAIHMKRPVLTSDRIWATLKLGIRIELVR